MRSWRRSRRADRLTGAVAPLAFAAAVDSRIAERGAATVVAFELDRRVVKAGLGRAAADGLLRAARHRVVDAVPGAVVSRLHGDEFAVLLPSAALAPDRIRTALAEPFVVDGRAVSAPVSVGVARYPDDGGDAAALVDSADRAMELAKERGPNEVVFHAPSLRSSAIDRVELEGALRRAVEHGELTVAYQPRIDLRTGEVWGAEALLRWEHPALGAVSPAVFVPIAEATGLIAPIGELVVATACRQLRAWDADGLAPLAVSVNVSPRQFDLQPLVATVDDVLRSTGVDPARLEVELTESAALRDVEAVTAALLELREMGVASAIDDFGTGYSSLGALRRLPFSTLKIDRAFVEEIRAADPAQAAVVRAVLDLCRSTGLRSVAEGVETAEQLAFLRRHGCDQAQGYLFSAAVDPRSFAEHVRGARAVGSVIDLRVDGEVRLVLGDTEEAQVDTTSNPRARATGIWRGSNVT